MSDIDSEIQRIFSEAGIFLIFGGILVIGACLYDALKNRRYQA